MYLASIFNSLIDPIGIYARVNALRGIHFIAWPCDQFSAIRKILLKVFLREFLFYSMAPANANARKDLQRIRIFFFDLP